jgi:hypothetical protein
MDDDDRPTVPSILQHLASLPPHVHTIDATAFRASLRSLHETSVAEQGARKERPLNAWSLASLVRKALAKSSEWTLDGARIVRRSSA